MQFWPSFTRYFSGDLSGEGGGNLDVTLGWSSTETTVATLVLQQNFDKDLNIYKYQPGAASGANDWNAFASVTWYFSDTGTPCSLRVRTPPVCRCNDAADPGSWARPSAR